MEKEKVFVKGMWFNEKNEKAADWILGSIAIKRDELIEFLQNRTDDKFYCDIKRSKKGTIYIEVSDWKPGQKSYKKMEVKEDTEEVNIEDVPF